MSSTTETLLHEATLGPLPSYGTLPARANTRYPEGTLVGRDENGRAYAYIDADASGYPAMGTAKSYFLNGTNDRALGGGGTGLDDGLDIELDYGPKGFAFTGTTPLPGDDMYVVDNQTISTDSLNGTRGKAGKCFEVRTTQGLAKAYIVMGPASLGSAGSPHSLPIPLTSFTLATGAPMAVFANGASTVPGFEATGSEALSIRWNNDAAPGAVACSVSLPRELDDTRDAVLEFLCSKSGATVGDATTLTITAFLIAAGDLYDADADAGGVSNAIAGAAVAKTTAVLTRTIANADIPAGARVLNFTVKPTAGLLGTDDFFIHEARLRYVRKY